MTLRIMIGLMILVTLVRTRNIFTVFPVMSSHYQLASPTHWCPNLCARVLRLRRGRRSSPSLSRPSPAAPGTTWSPPSAARALCVSWSSTSPLWCSVIITFSPWSTTWHGELSLYHKAIHNYLNLSLKEIDKSVLWLHFTTEEQCCAGFDRKA